MESERGNSPLNHPPRPPTIQNGELSPAPPVAGSDARTAPKSEEMGDDFLSGPSAGAGAEAEGGSGRISRNRWPREETLSLIKIRSDMDSYFHDAVVKTALWEEVSRKLGELGYRRSANKCKEKFENLLKYHKKTKDSRRSGRHNPKTYHFFLQLEAFDKTSPISSSTTKASPAVCQNVPPTTLPQSPLQMAHEHPSLTTLAAAASSLSCSTSSLLSSGSELNNEDSGAMKEGPSRGKKRKSRWVRMMGFFEGLMRQVTERHEGMERRLLEMIEKLDHERIAREEERQRQEMERIASEGELAARDHAAAAARNTAIFSFLQSATGSFSFACMEKDKPDHDFPSSITVESQSRLSSVVIGREKDRDVLIELLSSSHNLNGDKDGNVSIVAVTGGAGVGKTTLVQLVCTDRRIYQRFDLKAWVSKSFDGISLLKAITGAFCEEYQQSVIPNLRAKLLGKKLLLVLDDIETLPFLWSSLQLCLAGVEEARVIVTTRNQSITDSLQAAYAYHLEGLSEETCWLLFQEHAFDHRGCDAQGLSIDGTLVLVGKKIVKKCGGLPLCVKMIGGLLRHQLDVGKWVEVLESSIWVLDKPVDNILPAVRISYEYMPSHLKSCVAYCCLFPAEYKFRKNQLVSSWVTEGLVQPSGSKTLEEIGGEYFDELLRRSFFQKAMFNEDKTDDIFCMLDLTRYLSNKGMEDKATHLLEQKLQNRPLTIDEIDDNLLLSPNEEAQELNDVESMPDAAGGVPHINSRFSAAEAYEFYGLYAKKNKFSIRKSSS